MRHYKRMSRLLLTVSISLVVIMFTLIIVSDAQKTSYEFEQTAEAAALDQVEYVEKRIETLGEFLNFLRSSEYTRKYINNPEAMNRLMFYRNIQSSYSAYNLEGAHVAVSALDNDHVVTENSTSGVDFFLSQFGLTNAQLEQIMDYIEAGHENETIFAAAASSENPYHIFVRCERMGARKPLYLFVAFPQNILFKERSLDEGTVAVKVQDSWMTACGKYTREEVKAWTGGPPASVWERAYTPAVPGYQFFYYADKPDMFSQPIWLFLLALVSVVAIVVVLMLGIARRMWIPVNEVLNLTGAPENPEDEFAYIKRTILALHTKLENSVQQTKTVTENIYFRDLLENRTPGTVSIKARYSCPGTARLHWC